MVKLILYNCAHFGDNFFSERIVNHLVDNNKDTEFELVTINYSFLFKNIKNLKLEDFSKYPYLNQNTDPFIKINDNQYALNLWIAGINKDESGLIEANPYAIYKKIQENIINMNNLYGTNFYLPELLKIQLLPITPYTDISSFLNWYKSIKNDIIFYYNYQPMSGQPFPNINHNQLIKYLSSYYKDKIIIVPEINEELKNIENVIGLDEKFGYCRVSDGENVCKNTKINSYCNYIISFDIGACMNYIDYNIMQSPTKIIHCSINSRYFEILLNSIIDVTQFKNNNKILYLQINNDINFIENISSYIT